MSDFIKGLYIANFKKFDYLTLSNLGNVNLITGDNNVGKTSLLEALIFTSEPEMSEILASLNFIYSNREIGKIDKTQFHIGNVEYNKLNNLVGLTQNNKDKKIEFVNYFQNEKGAQSFQIENTIIENVANSSNTSIKGFIEKTGLLNISDINVMSKNWLLLKQSNKGFSDEGSRNGATFDLVAMVDVTSKYYNQYLKSFDYFPFIGVTSIRDNIKTAFLYDRVVANVTNKEYLLEVVNRIFNKDIIRYIEVKNVFGNDMLCIASIQNPEFKPITFYGEGMVRVIRIVIEILLNKGKKLMIDEVDTGLHFLRQKEVWKVIMELSNENNVQIFCTTHSSDCINAFTEAAAEVADMKEKIRLVELEEAKSKQAKQKIYASTYTYNQIVTGISSAVNLRGGTI